MDDYNILYKETPDVFGNKAEKLLIDFVNKNNEKGFALDIGAGQGRNAFYLANKGFNVDAVEPAKSAFIFLKEQNKFPGLNIYQSDFKDFITTKKYDLILIFGLLQILSFDESQLLARKVSEICRKGSYVLLTSFSATDESYKFYKTKFAEYKPNYFSDADNKYRSFPSIPEITDLFYDFDITYQNEYTGPLHTHGNSRPEKHEIIELILRKK